jgi:hypothetical protein
MNPLLGGLLGSLAGNYLMNKDDEEGTIWDKLGFSGAQAQSPETMTDPGMTIGGNPHVNVPQQTVPQQQITQQQITQQQTPTEEPGFFDKAGDFFGDEERMARITIALNSMRLNPDASIATSMENKIKSIRSKKKGNATAEALRKMGRTDLADLVESGVMDGKTAYGLAFKPVSALQEKIDLHTADPEKYAQMVKDGVISGGGVNINMGDGKYFDAIGKDVANMQNTWRVRGEDARDSLNTLNELNTAITRFGETGPDADTQQKLRVMAAKFGMSGLIDEQKMSDGQYVTAIKNRLVAEALNRAKGPQTDFDAEFAGTYIPGLGTSTEANNALMNYSKSISLQQEIFARMSANIRVSDFENAQKTIKAIDLLAMSSPAAMKKDDGTWITFNEFFNSDAVVPMDGKNVPLSEISATDRLKIWSSRYNKVRGFK